MMHHMDIHAEPGTKVVFHGDGGWPGEKEGAEGFLKIGKVYTVACTEVGYSRTEVWLEECDERSFNSTLFGDI